MDLDWAGDGYHKLNVTFAYTYWQNNSLQALGMQLVDYGINAVVGAMNSPMDGGSSMGQTSFVDNGYLVQSTGQIMGSIEEPMISEE